MGIFDLLNDTKKNMDKSRQAREYIQRAKELVSEGNSIYDKAYTKVNIYAAETGYKLKEHINYKKQIAQELGGSIANTLNKFAGFNIDSKVVSIPNIQESSVIKDSNQVLDVSNTKYVSLINNVIKPIEIPSIFNMLISDSDYYEAKRQRDEARQFKERMKLERDKLMNYREKMSEIRSFISEEKTELDLLLTKLRKMAEELETVMKKNSFSEEESDYFKGIHKIAECVVKLLSTEFFNDDLLINEKYQEAFSNIKEINKNIPNMPSLTDLNNGYIKTLLDNMIVY